MKLGLNITIVGLGLIGASYAMALKKNKDITVFGIDNNEETLMTAGKLNIVKKAFLNPEKCLGLSDIVIICLYPKQTIEFVKDNIKFFKKNSLITDTAGIKQNVVKEIQSFSCSNFEFIGGHPMAGSEEHGIEAARDNLFVNANYILTPTEKNKESSIEKIEFLIKEIGCSNITRISPEKHDKIISYVSQLPHVIASVLVNSSQENISNFIGGSFKDTARVASINSSLWSELMIDNKENLIEKIDLFQNKMEIFKDLLINDNIEKITSFFENGNKIKKGMI